MTKQTNSKGTAPAKLSPVLEAERNAIRRTDERRKARTGVARLSVEEIGDNGLNVRFDHECQGTATSLAMNDISTGDLDFLQGVVRQLADVGAPGAEIPEVNANFVLSVVRAVEPRNELETMLAMQMGATHLATMTMARRLANVETMQQQDSSERALNKLARTFTTQMQTLKKWRSTGNQKVTVEHVTVNEGGQAIVGAVQHGGGVDGKS